MQQYNLFVVWTTEVHGFIKMCGLQYSLPHYIYSFWSVVFIFPFFYANIIFRIPPLILETISVALVVYKAVQHYRTGAPKTWVGSRVMSSIVRYSVLYFVMSVSVAVVRLPF